MRKKGPEWGISFLDMVCVSGAVMKGERVEMKLEGGKGETEPYKLW